MKNINFVRFHKVYFENIIDLIKTQPIPTNNIIVDMINELRKIKEKYMSIPINPMNLFQACRYGIVNDQALYTKKGDIIRSFSFESNLDYYNFHFGKNVITQKFFKTYEEAKEYYKKPFYSFEEIITILKNEPRRRFYCDRNLELRYEDKRIVTYLLERKTKLPVDEQYINQEDLMDRWYESDYIKEAKIYWNKENKCLLLELDSKDKEEQKLYHLVELDDNENFHRLGMKYYIMEIIEKQNIRFTDLEISEFIQGKILKFDY